MRRDRSPDVTPRRRTGLQAWSTFVRNHARGGPVFDFFVAITATFRMFDVFVVSNTRSTIGRSSRGRCCTRCNRAAIRAGTVRTR
jgi:hypothetical protein